MTKVVIGSHFILISLSLDAFSSTPFIGFNLNPEDSVRRELFLSQIHAFPQLVLLFVKIILKVALDKDCFRHCLVMSFRLQYLFDLFVNWILLHFSKPEISGINRPVVRSDFLLSRVIVLVRFQIHLPDFFSFWHIFS